MMSDPYRVLGVSRDASESEIKKAYRKLSREYHPDANINSANPEAAAAKFREVQEAYNQIMDEKEGRSSSYGYGFGNNGSQYGSGSEQDTHFAAAINYINARRFQEALNVLDGIEERNARWYYLSAVANMGMGNNAVAMDYAERAASMEPGNAEYTNFHRQMQMGGGRYTNNPFSGGYNNYSGYGTPYGRGSSCGTGNLCCDLWCADSLCECLGGDICSCM